MTDYNGDMAYDARPLVRRLGKPPEAWQRKDLVELCLRDEIRVINFRYPSFDAKLRELRLPVNSRTQLDRILAAGERVDGSSLFPGIFGTGSSGLYAVPVYRWAFLNPWAEDELDIVCRFADKDGAPCPRTPDNVLAHAAKRLRSNTGADLLALAEIEFYLLLDRLDERYTSLAQRNYHQSAPYLDGNAVGDEIVRVISAVTGRLKYFHSEVGYIDHLESDQPEAHDRRAEQYEAELELMPIEDLGTWLTVCRWLIRVIADRHGVTATYVPKLDEDMAGTGQHVHLALERDGANCMCRDDGELSEDGYRVIGGLLRRARTLSAFGNTVAASYLRLVPRQEAPTRICWGRSNRSSLIRVPLNFLTEKRMDLEMNPGEQGPYPSSVGTPTVELRSPDGSAFPHLLLAALTLCIEESLTVPGALKLARRLEIEGDIASQAELMDSLEQLPRSAVGAARALAENREFFQDGGFPPEILDQVIRKLENEADEGLSDRLRALPAAERLSHTRHLMHKDLHKH